VHADKSGFGQQVLYIFKGHYRHVGFACGAAVRDTTA
jgi:hypothetical protein